MSVMCPKAECKAQKGLCGCEKKFAAAIVIVAVLVIAGKVLGWF